MGQYFGKSFVAKEMQGEGPGGHFLLIGNEPGLENSIPKGGEHFDAALVDLVDTLCVTRKLLKLLLKMKRVPISGANEFYRDMESTAKKIGESPDHVRVIAEKLVTELFQEMLVKPQSKKKC